MARNIALITGGFSGEAVISYKSADTIAKHIDPLLWTCYAIDIRADGWYYLTEEHESIVIDKNDFSITVAGKKIIFDAVLVGLHGTPAEDGKILGYFDCLHIPYTCCDAATAALTFNKKYTVAVAASAGIPVAKSIQLFTNNTSSLKVIVESLKFPVFVKPNNGGSSIGMSKVSNEAELPAAVAKAFAEDDQVLVEEFIRGREFTIGVYRHGGNIVTLPITEIISNNDFFDFEAKYHGASNEVTPAEIDQQQTTAISNMAKKVYQVFNCKAVVRIDFIFDEVTQQPVMLEINTVPGQSSASIIPQQVVAAGLSLKEFYSILLHECFN